MTYIILGVQKGPKETYIICFKAECFENKHTKTFWSKIDFRQFFCLQPILFLCVSFNDVLLVLCLNNLFLCLNIYQHFLLYIHTDLVKKKKQGVSDKKVDEKIPKWLDTSSLGSNPHTITDQDHLGTSSNSWIRSRRWPTDQKSNLEIFVSFQRGFRWGDV